VGRKLDFWGGSHTVVGVINDIHDRTLEDDGSYRFYVAQHRVGAGGSLVVRTATEPASLIPAIRQRLAELDPDLPVTSVLPMSRRVADSLSERRYRARLAATFAVLAAAFTAFAIYGVTSRSVTRRRPEIGVRLALGARPGAVVARTLRSGLVLAMAGIVLGLLASLAATRAIASYVYGTSPNDPVTLALVTIVLIGTAAVACLAPSMRAARTDPLLALRSE
jgi:cell division protein FtsX